MPGWSADALRRRLEHFVREDARIPEAVGALRAADAPAFGRLGDESQRDAAELLGNQVPETIALAAAARQSGAFAACSFGAGFGGSVWALVDSASATRFISYWSDNYRKVHPSWEPNVFDVTPGPALTRLI